MFKNSLNNLEITPTQQLSLSHKLELMRHSRWLFIPKVYIKEPPCIIIDLRDSHISLMVFVHLSSFMMLNITSWIPSFERSVRLSTPQNNNTSYFYGKSSENPYYWPSFDFIVGKALDLRKATFFITCVSLSNKKDRINFLCQCSLYVLVNVMSTCHRYRLKLSSDLNNTRLCHPTNFRRASSSTKVIQIAPHTSWYFTVPSAAHLCAIHHALCKIEAWNRCV